MPKGELGDFYVYVSGTSFATPMVAGIAGLVMAKRYHLVGEYLSDEELREIILMTAEDTICASDPPGFDSQYGRGRVNALRAVFSVSRGDVDSTFDINVSDAVYIIEYTFNGGPEPVPYLYIGDANCDGTVNVSDAVKIIIYVFNNGPAPEICYLNLPE